MTIFLPTIVHLNPMTATDLIGRQWSARGASRSLAELDLPPYSLLARARIDVLCGSHILYRHPKRLEQGNISVTGAPRDLARQDFPDFPDDVTWADRLFRHRDHDVARLGDRARAGVYVESGPSHRSRVQLPHVRLRRTHGVDVRARSNPLSCEHRSRRGRGRHDGIRPPRTLFHRRALHQRHPSDPWVD